MKLIQKKNSNLNAGSLAPADAAVNTGLAGALSEHPRDVESSDTGGGGSSSCRTRTKAQNAQNVTGEARANAKKDSNF